MADYETRKQPVLWTSPSGKTFTLKIKEGGYKRKHVGEVKTSPNDTKKNGQKNNTKKIVESSDTFSDMGVSGKDVPLECLFIGSSHDIEAENFTNALCEVGKSRLRLAYGKEFTVNVLDFEVKYSLTEKLNSTTVSVNFHQTSENSYPKSESSNTKAVEKAAAITNESIANNLANVVENLSETTTVDSINQGFSNVLNKISAGLDTVNNVSLNSIVTDIAGQSLTGNAFTMVAQMQQVLFKATATVSKVKSISKNANSSSFGALSRTWKSLINNLVSGVNLSSTNSNLTKEQVVNYVTIDTAIVSAISAISQAAVTYDFTTRKEATNAATALIELDEIRNNFASEQEARIDDLSYKFICDSGINELVDSAAAAIIEKSFELKVERTVILTEDESVVNLAYKYYPNDFEIDPEETINYLITSNSFANDQFFLLKRGTELKIYV